MTQAGPQPEPQGKSALRVRAFTGSKRFQHETDVALSSLAERRTARFTRPQKHTAGRSHAHLYGGRSRRPRLESINDAD